MRLLILILAFAVYWLKQYAAFYFSGDYWKTYETLSIVSVFIFANYRGVDGKWYKMGESLIFALLLNDAIDRYFFDITQFRANDVFFIIISAPIIYLIEPKLNQWINLFKK